MDNISDEYKNYWETNMFLQTEELDMSYFDDRISGYSDSSSPDGGHDSASKNIILERNRRKKLNDRLYALRAVVPNITKMDKASIIKDAIEYIQSLQDEEQRIQAEIADLQTGSRVFDFDQDVEVHPKPTTCCYSPIQILQLGVSYMREKTLVVSLTCSKGTDTMVRLCEIFESLNLNIITSNITAFSATLLKTVFLEGDEEEKEVLRCKIQAAIAALNDPHSPMTSA